MDKYFKCDCGGHILHVEYIGASKGFDWEEFAMGIYQVHNDKGTRKLKNPKLLSDVVLFNNASPQELDRFFNFMEKVLKNRKKGKNKIIRYDSKFMKPLNTSIKNLKIYLKKKETKEQARFKKIKARNKKSKIIKMVDEELKAIRKVKK